MLYHPLLWPSPLALETLSGLIFKEQEEILRIGYIKSYRGLECYQKCLHNLHKKNSINNAKF